MQITFEFFGVLERLAGAGARILILDDHAATVGDALERLAAESPGLRAQLERSACAVGDRLVLRAEPLRSDLRVALLPPVAGG